MLLHHLNRFNQMIRKMIHCFEFEALETPQAGGTCWSKLVKSQVQRKLNKEQNIYRRKHNKQNIL